MEEVSDQFKTLYNDLLQIVNKHIKYSKDLELRDFLSAIAICYVDIVRMAEINDPEKAELSRYRAVDFISSLILNSEFRNHKKEVFH